MAKKFVRGITDIKEINKQDFDTNNVNDLLSDGEHNYIHRKKKDNSEEYHNLTNNLKTITSDNTDLLSVTNYNNSTNSATLHPQHDTLKEQSIESTRNTITIEHGENATTETTKVDTNPQKVLEHVNLTVGYGINKTTSNNISNLSLEYTTVGEGFDLNEFYNGRVKGGKMLHLPQANTWFLVSAFTGLNYTIQEAVTLADPHNKTFRRTLINGEWTTWREQVSDKFLFDDLLAQKQNSLQNNESIAIVGSSLRQLYYAREVYTATNGALITHRKSLSQNSTPEISSTEFNFIVKINKNAQSVTFTLNSSDTTKFSNIMTTYGENNTVRISGCVFTLSGSTLTVATANNTEQNYVITFSDII